ALGFYLVSLNVASERSELEQVETRIALAQRDIRLLQTEIGTRGRLAQLERWNVKFIRLSAPTADQFVAGGFPVATMGAPLEKPAIEAPVVLASAPVEDGVPQPRVTGDAVEAQVVSPVARSASEMVHLASYSVPETSTVQKRVAPPPAPAKPLASKPGSNKPVTDQARQPAAATKPMKAAMADPLLPLSTAKPKAKGTAPAASTGATSPRSQTKDSVTD